MGDEQPRRRTTKGGTANDWDDEPQPPQAMMGWMTDNEWGMDDEWGDRSRVQRMGEDEPRWQ